MAESQPNRSSQTQSPGTIDEASILIKAGRVLNSTLNLSQLHDAILRLLADVCRADAAILLLTEMKTRDFVLMRGYNQNQGSFMDFSASIANALFPWIQSETPDAGTTKTPLPVEVREALEKMTGVEKCQTGWTTLRRRGRLSGAVGIVFCNHDYPDRSAILSALSDQIATALDNALLFQAVKRRSSEARILLQSTIALSRSLDLDETLTAILDQLREVIAYDAAGVFLVDKQSGDMAPIVDRGYDLDKHQYLKRKSDEGLVGYAASTGETVLVDDTQRDTRYKNARDATRSELVIPIAVKGKVIGAFNLERDIVDGFSADDVRLATAFAGSAGLAIERAQLYREALEKRRLDDELEIARAIQQTFLPKENPSIPGYDIAGMNVSSEEVGGDYYDFIRIIENQLGIAIGDVVGKGIPAALIMAAFRASLIAEIRNNYAIRTILTKVNALLEETGQRGEFVTAMYGVLDAKNGIFTFCNAGHNPGLLLRKEGAVEHLTEGGSPLGILRQAVYEERPVSIRPGDVMLWYTDGVTEATNKADEHFEFERLEAVLRENRQKSAPEILQAIHRAITEFADPEVAMDDVTMVVVKAL